MTLLGLSQGHGNRTYAPGCLAASFFFSGLIFVESSWAQPSPRESDPNQGGREIWVELTDMTALDQEGQDSL